MLRKRLTQLTETVVLSLTLSACSPVVPAATTPEEHSPAQSPPASSLTNEEALEASEALLERFRRQLSLVMADPSVDVSTLRPFMTQEGLEGEISAMSAGHGGARIVGPSSYSNFVLQTFDGIAGRAIVLYCIDMEEARVISPDGIDITPPDRPDEMTMATDIVFKGREPLIDSSAAWNGASQCD